MPKTNLQHSISQNTAETFEDKLGNKLIYGDNLEALAQLQKNSIELIYVDPPFNTGKDQVRKTVKLTKGDKGTKHVHAGFADRFYKRDVVEVTSYNDKFDNFINGFLRPRFEIAYDLLTDNGSLFCHIGWREAARCRLLLEEIFGGPEYLLSEIIWAYDYGSKSKKVWPNKHDNIYWLVKNPKDYIFNIKDTDTIPYLAPNLVTKEKAAKGKLPTDVWWNTIVQTNGKEKTGYPNQKPLRIMERIVKVHSNKNGTVLDFFAGSGTTGHAAVKNKRKYILIDQNLESIKVIKKRLKLTNQLY